MSIRPFYMPFLGLFALIGLHLAVQAAKPATISLEKADLDFEQMDPRCRSFLKTWRLGWKHAVREGWLFGHSADEALLKAGLHEARFYYSRLNRRLGGSIQDEPMHLLVFSQEKQWRKFLARAGLFAHSQALSSGNAIFLYRGAEVRDLSDLAHELVHVGLERRYGKLPLWLDEGLALQWSEELTQEFYSLRNRYVASKKDEQRVETEDFDITELKEYPKSVEAQGYFYRRSKAMVDRLQGLLGDEAFIQYLQAITQTQTDWRVLLKDDFNISVEQLAMVEARSMPKEEPQS